MLLGVRLHRLLSVSSRMSGVSASALSVVRCFFVVSSGVVLRGFLVMTSRLRMVFGSLFMVF
jgi:hypothetical protein